MEIFRICLCVILLVFTKSTIAQEPEVKVMQRLFGEGFHRTLYTVVNFSTVVENWNGSEDNIRNCFLDLKFQLDSGVYINPDELDDLQRLGKLNSRVKTKVNVEQAANEADPIELIVSAPVHRSAVKIKLPLHTRYHPPASNGGFAMNVIRQPQLFINCGPGNSLLNEFLEEALDYCNKQSEHMCYWRKLKFNMLTEPLVWEVPVGNLQHYTLVSFITCAVTVLGSLYLFRLLHVVKMKRLKNK